MKILFLTPPIWNQNIPVTAIRPIAPAMLNAGFAELGHDSIFIDSNALRWGWNKIGEALKEMDPDVVAFTSLYNNRFASENLTSFIKVNFSGKKIISGGPFATTNPESLLKWGVDTVCVGEGDLVLEEVLAQKGIIKGKMVEDLDSLPYPLYDSCMPEETYYAGCGPRWEYPEGWLLITRGCRHKCTFCSNPLFSGKATRFMGPDRVYTELTMLKDRGIKHVYLYSDELVGSSIADDKRLEEICDKIAPIGLTYKTQGRCSKNISSSTLEAMVSAGFKSVGWGIESFSPKVLKAMRKSLDLDDVYHTLRLSKKAGIFNWLFIMVGGFEEEVEDFEMTRNQILALKKENLIDGAQISIMALEPGAPGWQKAVDNGWIQETEFQYSHFEPTLNVPWASKEEIIRRQNILGQIIYGTGE